MRTGKPQPAEDTSQRRKWFHNLFLIAAGILVAAPIFVALSFAMSLALFIVGFFIAPFGGNDQPAEIDPSVAFSQLAGWQLPEQAEVLKHDNTHTGFTNDGDYTLVVRMSPSLLQTIMDHDSHSWSECPVAPEIANDAWSIPKHTGKLYWAQKTSESDTDWHRGHVVIVKPETGTVWIYEWKN
jgi:hypothetical protein